MRENDRRFVENPMLSHALMSQLESEIFGPTSFFTAEESPKNNTGYYLLLIALHE